MPQKLYLQHQPLGDLYPPPPPIAPCPLVSVQPFHVAYLCEYSSHLPLFAKPDTTALYTADSSDFTLSSALALSRTCLISLSRSGPWQSANIDRKGKGSERYMSRNEKYTHNKSFEHRC